jgi:hypothetical protein
MNSHFTHCSWSLLLYFACNSALFADGEKVSLSATRKAGELTRVTAKFEVRGDLKSTAKGEETKTPLTVVGDLKYDERLLAWGATHDDESRTVRYYAQADAHIAIDKQPLPEHVLPEEKRLIAARNAGRETTLFAPRDLLTRDELDLITLPGNSLTVDRLLPDDSLAVGETWKPAADAVTVLCDLDEADSVEVQGTLKEATEATATCEFSGNVEGRVDGVKTKLNLTGKFMFDRRRGRISWLALSTKEQREIGSISPGVDATARLQLRIEPLDESVPLAEERLTGISLEPTIAKLMLLHRSATGKFTFAHDRRWHVVTDDERVTVLRMIEDGELIAQANITPLVKQTPGKTITLEAFKADVERVLGQNLAGVSKAGESMNHHNYRVCRVEAVGKVNELEIQWIYYHVTDQDGFAAAVAFTLATSLTERFAGEDDSLVGSLQLIDPNLAAADAKPGDPDEQSADGSVLTPNRK